MRTTIALALALLVATPALAGAERLAVAEASAITAGISQAEVQKARKLFEEALRETGLEVTRPGRKALEAEFVTSLTLAKEGADVVLTAQVSRLKLDLWASRSEVRVQGATPDAVVEAVKDLAAQITLAVRTAPVRNQAQPDARPPARKLVDLEQVVAPASEQRAAGADDATSADAE